MGSFYRRSGESATQDSGFLYQGKIAALRGKYIFGDITTGRIWYVNYDDMLAADDGNPRTMAAMHEVQIVWNKRQYSTMASITEIAYHTRGGKAAGLPGQAVISGGRSDMRFFMDREGELYILSKGDGDDSRSGWCHKSVDLPRTAPGERQRRLVGESFHFHGQLRTRARRQPHGE